jgi:antitoxin component HigA of HigAB toxin-antitoxin module
MNTDEINQMTIKDRKEHSHALSRLEELMLMDPAEDTTEEAELIALATAIEAYEKITVQL